MRKKKIYTIKEISKMLNIPTDTLYNYVYRKVVKTLDVQGHVLIPESEVEKIKKWREKVNKPGRPKSNEGGSV